MKDQEEVCPICGGTKEVEDCFGIQVWECLCVKEMKAEAKGEMLQQLEADN